MTRSRGAEPLPHARHSFTTRTAAYPSRGFWRRHRRLALAPVLLLELVHLLSALFPNSANAMSTIPPTNPVRSSSSCAPPILPKEVCLYLDHHKRPLHMANTSLTRVAGGQRPALRGRLSPRGDDHHRCRSTRVLAAAVVYTSRPRWRRTFGFEDAASWSLIATLNARCRSS